ncbi:MAG: septal ring lytic transglycosylase RlpA family protein [Acidobacteriaceae bacterium]
MKILSDNSTLNLHSSWPVHRAASMAAGLFLGVALSLHGIHGRSASSPTLGNVSAAGGAASASGGKQARTQRSWHQIGLASWYGPQFQGKETADGETFNMHDLTCAHRFLPLGTWLKVTNLHTHKWIVVRVNDRGPVPDTRIADLSSEAARMLGIHARGVARVRLDVIDPQQAVEVARLDKLRQARIAAQSDTTSLGN